MIFLSILREDSDRMQAILQRGGGHADNGPDTSPRRRAVQALLQALLEESMGLKGCYRLAYEDSGRPRLHGPAGILLPSVSMTHSGGWVGCAATCDGDLGVDLEVAKAGGRDFGALAEAAFGENETASVRHGGASTFYRIWTLREARAKALGTGFAAVTDRQDHVPRFTSADRILAALGPEEWFWLADEPLPGLHLALALRLARPQGARSPQDSTGANHSTIQVLKCHVSPELIFSRTSGIDDARP
ncbi:MAG TPA: 4'-phosphopantetheinyl transferase superfamily protein [Terriglobia bacterium]|nr:4'-phosphopantetheinyl transferase superfamily protein [Terriglobia bacterium]